MPRLGDQNQTLCELRYGRRTGTTSGIEVGASGFQRRISPTPIAGSACEPEEDEDRSAESDHLIVVEAADWFAELGAWHGRDLVDHETARFAKPVHFVGFHPKSKQRGLGRIGAERAHCHRISRVEAVVLNDRDGSGLSDVAAAGSRSPDLPAPQASWSRLSESMNP